MDDEIKRPDEADWHDDDGGPWPVGTLVRRKVRRPAGAVRARVRRATLRVTGVAGPDADGDCRLLFEPAGVDTIEFPEE